MRNRAIVLAVVGAILVASVAWAAPPAAKAVQPTPTPTPKKMMVDFAKFRLLKLTAPDPKLKVSPAAMLAVSVLPQKKEISCGIFVWPPPNPQTTPQSTNQPTSALLYFVNTTGQTLPIGTQLEFKVSGVPPSCCHGFIQPLPFLFYPNPPTQHYVYTTVPVLAPPQEWVRECQAWEYPPKP
ncbi:MAG TPA: hypothetical protein VMT19_05105 [Thermoanaerobaculaceae bacterium]|nr:hypothetical protein [Thermoanaerobaculaceae bacterium]